MIHYLTHIKDTIGNNYIGIDIPNGYIDKFLEDLRNILGDEYEKYKGYQISRDGGDYHITVINVMEYNSLSKKIGIDKFINSLEIDLKYVIDDIKMMGIGTSEKAGNRTYYIVCKSDKLDDVRSKWGLSKYDFHITLGFKYKDVFGVRKDKVIQLDGDFLKLLSNDFYKSENWNFIRDISNFDMDLDSEIIPIDINKSRLKVRCDDWYLDICLMDDKSFRIVSQYKVDIKLPRLPETEIAKLLKQ